MTDTNMALSGVNKKVLEAHGGMARCFMADEEVAGDVYKRQARKPFGQSMDIRDIIKKIRGSKN